jgi:nucleotide-binding universal stress UspA family protein
MTLKKILVATDFSEPSQLALDQAIAVARQRDAELVLLWVEGEGSMAPSGAAIYGTAAREVERLIRNMREEAAARLDTLAQRATAQGVRARAVIETGDPAEVIVDAARDMAVDLVVTGTKGITGFKRFVLGSVATKVVRSCHTDVLVARGQSLSFARILVATDFSPASKKALRLAQALAAPGAEITLFHAWQYPLGIMGWNAAPGPAGGALVDLRDEMLEHGRQQGEAWIAELQTSGASMRFRHEYGAPAVLIQELLESTPHDLVAMGTHGYSGFRRFFLGSVAEATVRHAPCSVVVAHAGDEPAT